MPTNEIVQMVNQALEAMAVGIPAVFIVLAIFYLTLKLMMYRTTHPRVDEKADDQDADA